MTSQEIIETTQENKYNSSKIYKIYNSINVKVYVGSTTRNLCTRFIEHKSKANTKSKFYSSSIIINEDPKNCKIELVEHYPCYDLSELKIREAYWKNELDCVNIHTPSSITLTSCGGSLKKYYAAYKKENKEKIYQYNNEKFTCLCGGKYTRVHKAQHEKTKIHQKYLQSKLV